LSPLTRFSGLEAVAITRPAPERWASWEARLPTPPAPAMTTTDSPSAMCELVRSSCQAVAPWRTTASACASLTPSGTGRVRTSCATTFRRNRRRRAGRPPVGRRRPGADELRARDQRQLLGGEVTVLDLVRVGVVDPRRRHVVVLLAGDRHGTHSARLGATGGGVVRRGGPGDRRPRV
jgi:hypothetical protein